MVNTRGHTDPEVADSQTNSSTSDTETPTISQLAISGRSPVFFPVEAPKLKNFDPKSIANFLRQRSAYESLVAERRQTHGESITAVSIKSTIDPIRLKTFAKFEIGKSLQEVTDSDISSHLKQILKATSVSGGIDIDRRIQSEVMMDMRLKDPQDRIIALFSKMDELLEDLGIADLFVDEKGIKKKIKYLINGIRPNSLKIMVEHALEFTSELQTARKDEAAFYKLVLSKAKSQQEVHSIQMGTQNRKPNFPTTTGSTRSQFPSRPSTGTSTSREQFQKPATSFSGRTTKGGRLIPKAVSEKFLSRPPPINGCLVCKGPHWVQVCDTATSEQVKAAYDNLKLKPREPQLKALHNILEKNFMESDQVTFQNKISFPFELDNGASKTTLSAKMLSSISALAPVMIRTLDPPLTCKLATISHSTTMSKTAYLDLTLSLRAGTVNFRNIECYVTDEDMDTVLIGKPELFKLGIDPETTLSNQLFEAPNNRIDVEQSSKIPAAEASKLQLHRFVVQDDPGDADYEIAFGADEKTVTRQSIDFCGQRDDDQNEHQHTVAASVDVISLPVETLVPAPISDSNVESRQDLFTKRSEDFSHGYTT